MSNFIISVLFLGMTSQLSYASSKVRHIGVKRDQIVTVRTSLGIATIIEVPDRPTSVVLGDQDSFKVEYLEQAITIKPLISGAKSNLYVYTNGERFNIELVTGEESRSDYVVYLDYPKRKEPLIRNDPKITWTLFSNFLKNDDLRLDVKRLGRSESAPLVIEFKLTSSFDSEVNPEWFWLTQDGNTIPIHNLMLSSLKFKKGSPISGSFQVLSSDLDLSQKFRIELRRQKTSYLTIREVKKWK